MNILLSIIGFVLIASVIRSTDAFEYGAQKWGYEFEENMRLAYEYTEIQPKGIKFVELSFPKYVSWASVFSCARAYISLKWNACDFQATEERNEIAFIKVTDINEYEDGANAEVTFGGVGHTYAGIKLTSHEGGAIHSHIEIFEYSYGSIEEWCVAMYLWMSKINEFIFEIWAIGIFCSSKFRFRPFETTQTGQR